MSEFLKLGWNDWGKGILIAVLTAFVTTLMTYLDATPPALPVGAEWATIGYATLAAGLSYVLKNFLTNSQNKLMKKEK